jgi:ADP-ribosylation factor protein 1
VQRYKNIEFDMWDVGGQTKLRPLWRHYFNNTDALIFVVDSADLDRMGEAKNELHALLTDARLADSKLLVFANKQDLPGALPVDEVAKQFDLSTLRDREWFVQACCATNGEGVYEGLNWLSKVLCRR